VTEQVVAAPVTPVGEPEPVPVTEPVRWVDRLDRRLVNVVTVAGFAVPVLGYFWLLRRYSLNVLVSDQLSDLTVIGHSYNHLFDWSSLWAQHNENRIFFPNLLVVLLAHTTGFNVQVEEYLAAGMLVVSTALLIWSHKRRSPATPWLYYCPVAILSFSVVQYGNTLWGFQMAWFLVLVSLAAAVALVDRINLTWLSMVGAVLAAVVGSFSSLQGLLIWPAGLVLLYHRRRPLPFVVAWLVAGSASLALYLYHFDANAGAPYHAYLWRYPIQAVKFYLFAVGDVVGVPQKFQGPGNNAVLLLGAVILALAVYTLLLYGIRRNRSGGSPIGVALICVGLLFVATVTAGRIIFGYSAASQSRYTTYDLLIPIGIFLTLLERPPRSEATATPGPGSRWRRIETVLEGRWLAVARGVLSIVIVAQVAVGLTYGIDGARSNYTYQVHAVQVLKTIDRSSDAVVQYHLDVFSPAPFIRRQVRIAQLHHLSVFADRSGP